VIHVDLDGASDIYRAWGWEYPYEDDSVFDSGMHALLELFDRNHVRATLFVIADSLERPGKRALLTEAIRRGHDIASHSVTHANLRKADPGSKRREIFESREKIQQSLGTTVHGFRAPGYSIDGESLELLAECGYAYDASALPTQRCAKSLGTSVEALRKPHRPIPGQKLLEVPLPDHRPSPVPFSPSYALLLGGRYFRWGVERHRRNRTPLVLLFHLIDMAEPMPARGLNGWKPHVVTLSMMKGEKKRNRCQQMLDLVKTNFRLVSTPDLLREVETLLAAEPGGN
jgi:hypothetical protein